jgi:fructose-1,6-bisphosphatase
MPGGQFSAALTVDGQLLAGRKLFESIETVVRRAVVNAAEPDLDFLWYLWSGPRSPLFGKDRITTFERDFIPDKASHRETKDPYFALIHDVDFCDKVLTEFGMATEGGLIVNGHVPVKVESRRVTSETQRQSHHHRRRVFRSLRRLWLYAGAGAQPHRAG